MKKQLVLLGFLLVNFSLFGQHSLDLLTFSASRSNNIGPELHANGVFKYFIESDNLLRFGETERALLALDNAIAEKPFFVESYVKRAHLLFRIGRIEEGHENLRMAKRLNPYVSGLLGPGRREYKKEVLVWDTTFYKQAIEEVRLGDNEISNELRRIIDAQIGGDLGAAMKQVENLFSSMDNSSAILYGLRGNIYLLLNEYEKAIQDYTMAIQLEPRVANFYFNRGFAQLFTYDRQSACSDLEFSNQLGHEAGEIKIKHFCYN